MQGVVTASQGLTWVEKEAGLSQALLVRQELPRKELEGRRLVWPRGVLERTLSWREWEAWGQGAEAPEKRSD